MPAFCIKFTILKRDANKLFINPKVWITNAIVPLAHKYKMLEHTEGCIASLDEKRQMRIDDILCVGADGTIRHTEYGLAGVGIFKQHKTNYFSFLFTQGQGYTYFDIDDVIEIKSALYTQICNTIGCDFDAEIVLY